MKDENERILKKKNSANIVFGFLCVDAKTRDQAFKSTFLFVKPIFSFRFKLPFCVCLFNNKPLLLEPLMQKSPTFSTELKSGTFEKHVGTDFALMCQAQAFPVPLIRLVNV